MSDSEFGRGIVICLAKFSEHLHEHGPYSERAIREYAKWTDDEKRRCRAEAQGYPRGDAAAKLARMSLFEIGAGVRDGSKERSLSAAIELWANAASDHFYDLDEKAPKPLRELADLMLTIGHGFTSDLYTLDTLDRIRELWKLSCLELDAMLGVKDADWGQW